MEQEPHIIRRQLLEFVTDNTSGSYALQDEIALLYNELVLPMIDRCFSEVSAQRNIAPIDRLELDLGTLDRHNLRTSFLQKTEAALRKKLAETGGSAAARSEHGETVSAEGDVTSFVEEGLKGRVGNSGASTIPSEDVRARLDALHHGKTFHFNPGDEQEEEETAESRSSEKADGKILPGTLPKGEDYNGKTIQFAIDDSMNEEQEIEYTIAENHSKPSAQEEHLPVDEKSNVLPEDGMREVAGNDTIPNTTISEPSPTEENRPFHGKTIRFNTDHDRDDASIEHTSLNAEQGGTAGISGNLPSEENPAPYDAASVSDKFFSSKEQADNPASHHVSPMHSDAATTLHKASVHTPIALIRYYLQTGLFPWWARETSRDAFERAVRECILTGKDLPQLVALLNRQESLLRFTSLPDEVVRAVAVAISPMNETTLVSMQPSWERLLPAGRLPARQHWWITIFSASAARRLTQANAYDPSEIMTAFLEPYPEQPSEAVERKYRNTYSKRLSLLEKFFSQNGFAGETARLRTAHELLSKKGSAQEEPKSAQWNAVHHRLLSGEDLSEGLLPLAADAAEPDRGRYSSNDKRQPAAIPKAVEPVVNYQEKLFIDNAGLVLIWPFLTLFFERLGLTEENRFKHVTAQEKAMIALEILACGNEQAPFFEACLPLNKILCGTLPETPVNTDHSFRKAELKTIDGLLAAVMERSELGKNLSAAGFREAWLQRKGALSVRDGNWLLQLERHTYDVLLDNKLPWAVNIVKLPWMDHLLAVEW